MILFHTLDSHENALLAQTPSLGCRLGHEQHEGIFLCMQQPAAHNNCRCLVNLDRDGCHYQLKSTAVGPTPSQALINISSPQGCRGGSGCKLNQPLSGWRPIKQAVWDLAFLNLAGVCRYSIPTRRNPILSSQVIFPQPGVLRTLRNMTTQPPKTNQSVFSFC